LTFGDYFTSPTPILGLGAILTGLPLIPKMVTQLRGLNIDFETEKSPSIKSSASK